jgi:hypothetical protein
MSGTDSWPSYLAAPPSHHGWQQLIPPAAGCNPAHEGSLRHPRCLDRLPLEGIRRFRREEPPCAPSWQAGAGDSSSAAARFLRGRERWGGQGRVTGGRGIGRFGLLLFCACFCGGSSSNLFQVSWQRAGSNASGRSGAGRSLYFVAPAGRNSSSERVFRGFSPGAGEKNPFGRASSEAGGEAVNEALPKGLLAQTGHKEPGTGNRTE